MTSKRGASLYAWRCVGSTAMGFNDGAFVVRGLTGLDSSPSTGSGQAFVGMTWGERLEAES